MRLGLRMSALKLIEEIPHAIASRAILPQVEQTGGSLQRAKQRTAARRTTKA